jgi:NifU-like protein involved in Fe-S cluster formation
MSRFSDTLMDHFQSPANRGTMDCPDLVGKGSVDGYPPFVMLYLRIQGNRIIDATFEAEGCGVTIACGSMLTQLIRTRNQAKCREITAQDLSKALDGIPSGKEYCAHVTIAALRDAIRNWSLIAVDSPGSVER